MKSLTQNLNFGLLSIMSIAMMATGCGKMGADSARDLNSSSDEHAALGDGSPKINYTDSVGNSAVENRAYLVVYGENFLSERNQVGVVCSGKLEESDIYSESRNQINVRIFSSAVGRRCTVSVLVNGILVTGQEVGVDPLLASQTPPEPTRPTGSLITNVRFAGYTTRFNIPVALVEVYGPNVLQNSLKFDCSPGPSDSQALVGTMDQVSFQVSGRYDVDRLCRVSATGNSNALSFVIPALSSRDLVPKINAIAFAGNSPVEQKTYLSIYGEHFNSDDSNLMVLVCDGEAPDYKFTHNSAQQLNFRVKTTSFSRNCKASVSANGRTSNEFEFTIPAGQ